MRNDLLRDLLIVNRRIFDDAVASLREQTNRDIDRVLREASLWAYKQGNRRPKDELQRVNHEAQQHAERRIADIQNAAAASMEQLKTEHSQREQRIRAYCDQLGNQNLRSGCHRASTDPCSHPQHGE